MIMAESSTRPYADAKLPQKGESQGETTENVEFLRPLQLPEENEYILLDEQKLQDLMKKANEESSQLGGLLATENMLMIEVCTSLARILKKLHASCIIPLESLPLREEVSKAVLNEEAHLKLFYGTERERSAFLAEWPPEIVMAVLSNVIPELPKVIGSYKMMITKRVSFFEEIKKNLRSIVKSIINTNEENTSLGGEQRQNAPQKNSRAEEQK
jgi:hypothetical protein